MWTIKEGRHFKNYAEVDGIDVTDKLLDLNIKYDLEGSSPSSIFGSVKRYEIEAKFLDLVEGSTLKLSFGHSTEDVGMGEVPNFNIKELGTFKIFESEYDEKEDTTTLKAETDLSNLDDDFSLQTLPNEPSENLIPNGWDSFQPYGSGKIVFESDFTDMWNDQFINDATGKQIDNGVIEKTNDVGRYDIWKRIDGIEDSRAFVTVKIRAKTSGKFQISFGTGEKPREVELINDNTFQTYYFETPDIGNNNLLLSFFEKGVYELKELKVSNNNDRHLVVEKTPLDNGLTRIQTWGGNSLNKYRVLGIPMKKDIIYTDSIYVENIGNEFVISSNTSWEFKTVKESEKGFFKSSKPAIVDGYTNFSFKTKNINDNLDFIASDPQIVEGIPDRMTNSIIENSLKDGETVDLPSINLPVGDLSDKFYARRLDLYQDIAKLTKTYLEVHDTHYVFRGIVEQDITLPVFELEHGDILEPIDTVDITWHYGDNVADGTGDSIIQLDQVELIRDMKEELAPVLLGIYKGFTHQALKFTSPAHPFIDGRIKLDSKDGIVDALITKMNFDANAWVAVYESEIVDQEANHTNFVSDYDRGWRETQILVDKVNGEIILLNEVVEETGDKVTELKLDVDSITAKVNSLNTNDNIIVNLAGTLDNYEYWTFEGNEPLRYYEGLRYKQNLRYNTAFEVIPTDDTLSRHRLSFHSKNKAVTAEGFVIPDTIYSFRAIRYKGSHAITCSVREYDASHKFIREVPYKLQSTKVLSFSHMPSENTKFIRLAFHIPTSTYSNRQEISDLMFNRGEPKEFRTSSGDVKLWAESEIKQLDDSVTVAIDKVDETDYKINNTTVKITPEEGVEIWSTRGKGLTIRDSSGNETITLNTDGSLNMIGNLTAGTVGGLIIKDQVISFPGGKIEFDTENNAIVFGSLSMSYDQYDNMDSIHFSSDPNDKYDGLRIVTRRGHSGIYNVRELQGYLKDGKSNLDIEATNLLLNSHTTKLLGSQLEIGTSLVPVNTVINSSGFNVVGKTINFNANTAMNIHANNQLQLMANNVIIGYSGTNTITNVGSRVLQLTEKIIFSSESSIQMVGGDKTPYVIRIDKNGVLWVGGRQVAYR